MPILVKIERCSSFSSTLSLTSSKIY
uniref:Uncharacterized protein n=1 Tax=Arundo donax TaxID=35708 RepID=A0A0A8ZQ24_ARUDO